RPGCASATQGPVAATSKNTAPLRRTARSTDAITSVCIVHPCVSADRAREMYARLSFIRQGRRTVPPACFAVRAGLSCSQSPVCLSQNRLLCGQKSKGVQNTGGLYARIDR